MTRIRVGIVGVGFIGMAHMEAIRRIPGVEVVAVCDGQEATARSGALQYGVAWHGTDYRDMIARAGVDVIHNCTPNAMHDPVNLAAIDAGIHVYAEKPLSNSAAEAYAVWQRAEQAGVVHGLNHQYRMNVAVQEMRARVRRGDVGRVFLVSGRYHQQSGLYDTDYNWRMTEGGLSCGLSDIGTHWVDTARCVTGARIERVFANVQTIHSERTRPDGQRVEVRTDDLSTVMLEFEGGIQGVVTVSKVSAGHMNDLIVGIDGQNCSLYWEQESQNHLRIGYKGRPNEDLQVAPLLVDPQARDLATLPGGHPLGFQDALTASMREFYAAVRGEISRQDMRCATFEDGFEGMAFVEAAMRSQQTRQWASIERP